MKSFIYVWSISGHTHVDLAKGLDLLPFRSVNHRTSKDVEREVKLIVDGLVYITGFEVHNTTSIDV
jgi:hypothetical protein